jgi:hypothetical protein
MSNVILISCAGSQRPSDGLKAQDGATPTLTAEIIAEEDTALRCDLRAHSNRALMH